MSFIFLRRSGFSAHYKKANIVDVVVKARNFNTIVAEVKVSGLADAFKGKGPYTIFAPTNGAFAKLSEGTVEKFLKPENKH